MKYIAAATLVMILAITGCSNNESRYNEPQQSSYNSMTRIKQRPMHVKPMPPHAKYSSLDTTKDTPTDSPAAVS